MSKKTKVTEEVTEQEDKLIEEEELTLEEAQQLAIEKLELAIKDLQNEYLKEKADLENIKKRLEKERTLERKYAAMNFAKKLVSPLDTFELALSHEVDDEATKNFLQGFKMIQDQIKKALEEEGVSEIDALDEDYDPNFHQAIMTEKREGVEPNKVIEVLQKGYMFKDRVIRPVIVKISE
ncbi:Protein GrpE [Candidatus Izimaplasma bacterium HR1]|jgi:molecular chaperone GrpE|uniref:nucleotide exchange factor GrpE n=1 Tax=Candidatus Izimoplasma sp. HR1 TaxID=1541959 RepID=UPI0004F60F6D|nr:Protein GrpE [Candidatus Izimaplasma bacterium HR1]